MTTQDPGLIKTVHFPSLPCTAPFPHEVLFPSPPYELLFPLVKCPSPYLVPPLWSCLISLTLWHAQSCPPSYESLNPPPPRISYLLWWPSTPRTGHRIWQPSFSGVGHGLYDVPISTSLWVSLWWQLWEWGYPQFSHQILAPDHAMNMAEDSTLKTLQVEVKEFWHNLATEVSHT